MVSYSDEINVVGQANDKTVSRGGGRNLQEGNSRVQYPVPQHHDVNVERRDVCLFDRLAGRKEQLDLVKQVIPKPYHGGISRTNPKTCHPGFRCDTRDAGTSLLERPYLAIYR